jgi:hypothetical protein
VDLIRFGLLLTMTVALISVAMRHDDNSSGRDTAARGHHSASAAPSPSSGQAEAPSQGGSTPSQAGSTPAQGGAGSTPSQTGTAPSGTAGESETPKENGGGGGEVATPTLPRTGGTQAVELAALAALFIAAGSFGMRISRPRAATVQATTVQADSPPIAATQAGHPLGSSESKRPGTV